MAIALTPADVKEFCSTSLSDAAISSLICVVQAKMGTCAEDAYTECLAKQVLVYAVCHLVEAAKGGSVTSKRAANGASVNVEQYGSGEGLKSTPSGRLLIMIDTEGCYELLIASPLLFTSIGEAARPC